MVGGEHDGCNNTMGRWQSFCWEVYSSILERWKRNRGGEGFGRRGEFWGKDVRKAPTRGLLTADMGCLLRAAYLVVSIH